MRLRFWLHYEYGRLRGRPTKTMTRWIVGCTQGNCQNEDCFDIPARFCRFVHRKSPDEVIACLVQGKLVWSDTEVTAND